MHRDRQTRTGANRSGGRKPMELDPLDEHPIHQVPMSMAYVATSRP